MMDARPKPITILMADDDADDRLMVKEALDECRLANDVRFVFDGVELLSYLRRQGRYADTATSPRPGLILLDLNMPKMDGREALKVIKADASLRQIPIVVMTTSRAEEDIYRTYDLGVSSYVAKPMTFESLVNVMKTLGTYWFEIVALPVADRPPEVRA
jgi:CheY-like chemotaxis protein